MQDGSRFIGQSDRAGVESYCILVLILSIYWILVSVLNLIIPLISLKENRRCAQKYVFPPSLIKADIPEEVFPRFCLGVHTHRLSAMSQYRGTKQKPWHYNESVLSADTVLYMKTLRGRCSPPDRLVAVSLHQFS